MKKKLFVSAVSLFLSVGNFVFPTSVFAQGRQDATVNDTIQPKFMNDIFNRKAHVRTYREWSPYTQVSSTLHTGPYGGYISCNRSLTFGVTYSGDIGGLQISFGPSVSSSYGYTLNVGPNRRAYMGYSVLYEVETGINEYYDITTGKVVFSAPYTVKTPINGEYGLVEY